MQADVLFTLFIIAQERWIVTRTPINNKEEQDREMGKKLEYV